MRPPVGSEVIITYAQEKGRILEWIDDQLALVHVESTQEELPVTLEDLVPTGTTPGGTKPTDVNLAFVAGSPTGTYEFYLTNESRENLLFEIHYRSAAGSRQLYRGLIEPEKAFRLGEFQWDELNEFPLFLVRCWPQTQRGTGSLRQREIRLKAKKFTAPTIWIPSLNQPAVLFPVFSLQETLAPKREDLRSYTQDLLSDLDKQTSDDRSFYNYELDLQEIASFNPTIDLHLEALMDDPMEIPKEKILSVQVKAFEDFLEKAHRLGVERIFVIHGLGKGVLRKAIHQRLLEKSFVQSFKNEYHPLYGYGCTEVVLL